MSAQEIRAKAQDLRELKRMQEELEAEIEAAQDEIKAYMTAHKVEALTGTDYKITYQEITSSRLDTVALRRDMPEIAAMYTKKTTAKRFTLA